MTQAEIDLGLDIGRAVVLLLAVIAGVLTAGAFKGRWFVWVLVLGLVGRAAAYQDTFYLWVPIPAVTVASVNYPSCTVPPFAYKVRFVPPSTYITMAGGVPTGWVFSQYPAGNVGIYESATGAGFWGYAITVSGYASAFRMYAATFAGGGTPSWQSSTCVGIAAFIRSSMSDGGGPSAALPELVNNPRFCDYENGVYKTRPALSGGFLLNQVYRDGVWIGELGGDNEVSLWNSLGLNGAVMAGATVAGTGVWVRASADDYGSWQIDSPVTSVTAPPVPPGAIGNWVLSAPGSGLMGPSGIQQIWGWDGTKPTLLMPEGLGYGQAFGEYVQNADLTFSTANPLKIGGAPGMSYGQGAMLIEWEKTASAALRSDLWRQNLDVIEAIGGVKSAVEESSGGGGVTVDNTALIASVDSVKTAVNDLEHVFTDVEYPDETTFDPALTNFVGMQDIDNFDFGKITNSFSIISSNKVSFDTAVVQAVCLFPVEFDSISLWYTNTVVLPLVGETPICIDMGRWSAVVWFRAVVLKALILGWIFAVYIIMCRVATG
jgi:hypothetical protein